MRKNALRLLKDNNAPEAIIVVLILFLGLIILSPFLGGQDIAGYKVPSIPYAGYKVPSIPYAGYKVPSIPYAGYVAPVAFVCLIALFLPLTRGRERFPFAGNYYPKNEKGELREEKTISQLSGKVYKIVSYVWEGVGLLDGDTYYGIYRYNDNSERSGTWGVHKATLYLEDGRWVLRVSGETMNDSNVFDWGKWVRADDD